MGLVVPSTKDTLSVPRGGGGESERGWGRVNGDEEGEWGARGSYQWLG